MRTRQTDTRDEWKVTIARGDGWPNRVEYAVTEAQVARLRAQYTVLTIERVTRTLDW